MESEEDAKEMFQFVFCETIGNGLMKKFAEKRSERSDRKVLFPETIRMEPLLLCLESKLDSIRRFGFSTFC